jgi:hypothetical protein
MREFIMNSEQLDDGSQVINFDLVDDDEIVQTGGYVMVRQELIGFIITAFDGEGNVVSDYTMPYDVAYKGV